MSESSQNGKSCDFPEIAEWSISSILPCAVFTN